MQKIKKFYNANKTKILFALILVVAIVIRVYRLEEVPYGINVDEAGMAYDAYCLANYGTDRYLNHLPVYLINFGGGQSALYAYLASFLIKIFGFSIFIIRLPAVILGIIAIICSFLIAKKYIGDKFALTVMALITICPWHIMASRWGLDCNLLAPMSIISIYLLLNAKRNFGYIIAGISFGLTLYTYALSYIIMPVFLGVTLLYMLYTKKITLEKVIILSIPIIILAWPLILMIMVNKGIIPEIKGFITIPKMWFFRVDEVSLKNIPINLKIFNIILTKDELVYNTLPEAGTVYYFAGFLSMFGFFLEIEALIKNIKNKKFELNSVFLFLYIAVMVCMLIISSPDINKANAAFIPMLFFACSTIKMLYKNHKIFLGIIIILYYVHFAYFIDFYFNQYSIKYKYQPFFEQDLIDNINYVKENFANNNIYINTDAQQPYIYTLMLDRISPYELKESLHDGYKKGCSYGRYYFSNYNINDNAIYILRGNQSFVERLKTKGFVIEMRNSYVIAYK